MTSTTYAPFVDPTTRGSSDLARPSFRALLRLWTFRWESRRALATLDATGLADINVSRGDAALEARKPFWRA